MRVLVLGANGMLGVALCYEFKRCGFDTVTLARPAFDANLPDFARLEYIAPEAVVNAIGLVNRRLDRPEAEFLRINSLFPRRLADWCGERSIPLVHISTDCVFRGDAAPYDETSRADASDLYGRSKLWGEAANALVIRTSILGPELENHYALLCWFLRQHGAVNGFVNHRWNGVTTLELGRAIATIFTANLWRPGLRHVHGEDLTKYELLRLIGSAFSREIDIRPTEDSLARDTRLRTVFPEFLEVLAISSMAEQLDRVRRVSDEFGHWAKGAA